jgi:DNA replication and repair protein RecF
LRPREIAAGVTLVGPLRDDVRFLINGVDAGIYGSRGQQRTSALALKLAEVDLMQRETGDYPVLLLDDVLSELDERRRHFLVHTLEDNVEQVIITTTDLHTLPEAFLQRCHLWQLQMGRLGKMETGPTEVGETQVKGTTEAVYPQQAKSPAKL